MTNLKEKEIRDYLNDNKDMPKSKAICEVSEKFNITLEESLEVYNEYEKFERLIEESNEVVNRYIRKSENLKKLRESTSNESIGEFGEWQDECPF